MARKCTAVTKGHSIGPLRVYKSWIETDPPEIGINVLSVGDVLYDPDNKRELGRVLALDPRHQFLEGSNRDGVLLRSSVDGAEDWTPRTNLNSALYRRAPR